jgi:hypothetical protein
MPGFAMIRALGTLLFLIVLTRPSGTRRTGRHRIGLGRDGYELRLADGTLLQVGAVQHEGLAYLVVDADPEGAAIAGLQPSEARRLGVALLRSATEACRTS